MVPLVGFLSGSNVAVDPKLDKPDAQASYSEASTSASAGTGTALSACRSRPPRHHRFGLVRLTLELSQLRG